MKAQLSILLMALVALTIVPAVIAVDLGEGIGVDIVVEDFPPQIWMCDNRVVVDDFTEPGRISGGDDELVERIGHYAFEGEQISWQVLVFDKNKIEQVDVMIGGDIAAFDVECKEIDGPSTIPHSCNAKLLEEDFTGDEVDSDTMQFYECTYTVTKDDSGETFITIEADDGINPPTEVAEGEWWFFNPEIFLSIDSPGLIFDNDGLGVRPGTTAYSEPFRVMNGAEDGSNVYLDMFIFGDDFEGSGNCPDTNQLSLTNFAYYATHGAYSTSGDARSDAEGYVPINYGNNFASDFYDVNEVLQEARVGPYFVANVLAPNDWFTVTVRLDVPEPCNGVFDQGEIQFWAEAI